MKIHHTAPSFQHPQQLSSHLKNPKHIQDKSYTNNLHFKKNLVKIGLPYQKLFNFGHLKTILPLCGHISLFLGFKSRSVCHKNFSSRFPYFCNLAGSIHHPVFAVFTVQCSPQSSFRLACPGSHAKPLQEASKYKQIERKKFS